MEWRAGEAKWRQIERVMLDEIATGNFKPGQQIPTESELADRFGVNRHTVRRAVAALAEAEALRVEQGRGTFVQESVLDYALGRRTRFSQIVTGRQKLPRKRLIDWETLRARSAVAKQLHLRKQERVVRLFSVSEADAMPVA